MEDNEEVWLSQQAHNDHPKARWLKFWMMETSQKPYPVTNGVNQGCVLSPALFSMVFLVIRTKAFQDPSIIVRIEYLSDCDGTPEDCYKGKGDRHQGLLVC